jgi:NADPH-dependent glutamate synthase beta subunit-like oxidoreductase
MLGGGNAAIDAARSALRLGAQKVTVLYRRSRQEMPAYAEEIEEALREGIELHPLAIPRRIVGNGNVTGIEYVCARLGDADDSGRRRPVPIEGTETILECDVVIVAIGQVPSTESMIWQDGPEVTKWGTVKVDPVTMTTRVPGVFAAGDCVTGGTTVIEAIAGGQRAAVNIDKLLGGPGRLPGDVGFAFTAPSEEELMAVSTTQKEKSLPVRKRKLNFHEVVLGLGPKQAVREANRCLRCDLQR